tara:strand:+ start:963 stop:1385 length:423 start_codon:yes stop_codon:yes gene_type:complete
MAEMKTKATTASVSTFLKAVENPVRRADALAVKDLMSRITGWRPRMWGPSMIGFGQYHYKYDSGREGDLFVTGFSPRKASLVIYIMPGYRDYGPLMAKLGKLKTGKSCLYINKLADVDLKVLETLIRKSVAYMKKKYAVK